VAQVAALSSLAALAKFRISALSTLSGATGFVVFARELRAPLAATVAGTFLLASGAAALNEVLDRERDARMDRTRARPIPAGRIGVATAVLFSVAAAAAGAAVLWIGAGLRPALLGLGALVWYDAVYTPLKRITAFSVLPGAVVGALPPAIGWSAAGGALGDVRLQALCAFFLLWQIPHFWLLALRYRDDFERGGFPTPASRLSPEQMARITFVWTLSTAGAALLLPLFGATRGVGAAFELAAAAVALSLFALRFLRRSRQPELLGRAFAAVNLLAVLVMAILVADALL
jgi:protoheme IX farnesyltransferase